MRATRVTHAHWRLALTLGVALGVAGCGDDGSSPADPSTTTDAVPSSSGTDGTTNPDDTGSTTDDPTEGDPDSTGSTTEAVDDGPPPYEWELPAGFPEPWVPESNPMTADKVELGRHLFYEVRLSANETQSCGSCHAQSLAFADGEIVSLGSTGEVLARNSMGLSNAAYSYPKTWASPQLTTLEQQILVPLFGEFPTELGVTGHEDEILARLSSDPLYQGLFADAFGDDEQPYSFENVAKALACFVRTMISGNSPFDRYSYQGELAALTEQQIRGMDLFYSEGLQCHHCHNGFNLSDATRHAGTVHETLSFHNTGLYNLDGAGAYPLGNQGLIESTFEAADMGAFRAQTLRNIALTGPYMHDGSVATLSEVLDIYASGGRVIGAGANAGDGTANPHKSGFVSGFAMSDQEREDLLSFFDALTDDQFITDPRLSDPFE